jgi:DNA-binding response OmpR family regulator
MTGIEVLTRLRQVADQTPILMLTAKDATEDRIRGLDFGADDYLVKPFAIGELLARIRALIRRHYSAKNPIITIGNLSLDTIAKRLTRNEQWIELSAMEYSLLEYLALRVGQVVSRTDIWNHLYDLSDDSHSNVVDVYIGYLRKKLESDGSARILHTRRGLGYVLEGSS